MRNFSTETKNLIQFFNSIDTEKHNFEYAAGKWSIKKVLKHIIDTERIFSYRYLVIIRNDKKTEIQQYDEDFYMKDIDSTPVSLSHLLAEFKVIRSGLRFLITETSEEQNNRAFKIGNGTITPRAISYIMLGHAKHHLDIIKERYL